MVLGESQILNQIKTAYTGALAVHATRTILNTLFTAPLPRGKESVQKRGSQQVLFL